MIRNTNLAQFKDFLNEYVKDHRDIICFVVTDINAAIDFQNNVTTITDENKKEAYIIYMQDDEIQVSRFLEQEKDEPYLDMDKDHEFIKEMKEAYNKYIKRGDE